MLSWTVRALNVMEAGNGPDVLVLAHGFGADQSVWRPYVDMFAGAYRVVTYDLACAATADPEFFDLRRHDSLEGYVDDLLGIIDDLRISRCRLVGHSVSGMIGLLAAARRPSLIDKLIMIGASACYLNDGDYQGGLTSDAVTEMLVAAGRNYHEWAQNYATFAVDRPANDPARVTFANSLAAMRPDIALGTAKMILLGDYRGRLAGIDVPAAIVQPRHDPAVPFVAARYLHDHLVNSVMEIIDTTGHMPHMTSVEVVKDVLRRHLGHT